MAHHNHTQELSRGSSHQEKLKKTLFGEKEAQRRRDRCAADVTYRENININISNTSAFILSVSL